MFSVDMRTYLKEMQKENHRHMSALREGFEHQTGLLAELVSSKLNKDQVREIVHEEIQSFVAELSLIKGEVIEHGRTLGKHNKRITKLENMVV